MSDSTLFNPDSQETFNALVMHNIPKSWSLYRIEGRKHHEVRSHISLDYGGTMLCGRNYEDLVWDSCGIWMPQGAVYAYSGSTAIVHVLCRTCLKHALAAQRGGPEGGDV